MIDVGMIDIDPPHLWIDENGLIIGDGTPPFVCGDRVYSFDGGVGTVEALAQGDDYTFRVLFDDCSWGKFSSTELVRLQRFATGDESRTG